MRSRLPLRAAAVVTCGVVFAALVHFHVRGVNGPEYWHWRWAGRTDLGFVALATVLAALPALTAQWLPRRVALPAILLSLVALQWTANAIHIPGHGVEHINAITRSWISNSYFNIAEPIVEAERSGLEVDWLGRYDEVLRQAPLHAKTKPPGPVGFYIAAIRAGGAARAPLLAAAVVSLLSAAAVLALWSAVRVIATEDAALQAATLLALAPSMTLFLPQLDLTYPLLSCAMLTTWFEALTRGTARAAAAFGLLLFAATLTSYSLLVLGAPLAAMTLFVPYLGEDGSMQPDRMKTVVRRFRLAGIAVGTCAIAYGVFWLATRFDPISTFRTAASMQTALLAELHRPYPLTIPFDLLDFALGGGWVPVVLAAFWVFTRARNEPAAIRATALGLLATPFIVAGTGLLQGETARVWIFLLPMLLIPASLELSHWPKQWRFAAHATLVLVTIVLFANMRFGDPV